MGKVTIGQLDLSQVEESKRDEIGSSLTRLILLLNPHDTKLEVIPADQDYRVFPTSGIVGYNFDDTCDQRAFSFGLDGVNPQPTIGIETLDNTFYFYQLPKKR